MYVKGMSGVLSFVIGYWQYPGQMSHLCHATPPKLLAQIFLYMAARSGLMISSCHCQSAFRGCYFWSFETLRSRRSHPPLKVEQASDCHRLGWQACHPSGTLPGANCLLPPSPTLVVNSLQISTLLLYVLHGAGPLTNIL